MVFPAILIFGSALLASGSLFAHKRIMTYLAAAGVLWQGAWLLLTLLSRTVWPNASSQVFWVGSVLLLVGAVYLIKRRSITLPLGHKNHDLVGDIIVIGLTLAVLLGAHIIVRANGFFGYDYTVHGFYNGDVATFTALVNRSLLTNKLVVDNPFAAGTNLEYPTLLHAGVAQIISNPASSWLRLLPTMTYLTVFLTIPMFFLVWDTTRTNLPKQWWISVALIVLVLTASWDTFVYPQSHFFITGLLLLLIALLHQAAEHKRGVKVMFEVIASIVAFILLQANAITGTVAAAAIGAYFVWEAFGGKSSSRRVRGSLIAALLTIASFLILAPGEPAFGGLRFSYTAASDMLRLTPLLAFLLAGIFLALQKNTRAVLLPTSLIVFAFAAYIFSARDIVVANASRFLYHALLVAFPLIAEPFASTLTSLFKRIQKIQGVIPRVAGWALTLSGIGFLLLPSGASMASAYDNLLFQDEQTTSSAIWAALWWVEDNVAPDAVFLASPDAPFAIPAFTGRSLLRTNYWLSPDDVLLEDVQAAFAGNMAAREQVFTQADYLFLTADDRVDFEPLPEVHKKVFDNGGAVIYELAQSASSR